MGFKNENCCNTIQFTFYHNMNYYGISHVNLIQWKLPKDVYSIYVKKYCNNKIMVTLVKNFPYFSRDQQHCGIAFFGIYRDGRFSGRIWIISCSIFQIPFSNRLSDHLPI